MMGRTHMAFGVLAGLIFFPSNWLYIALTVFGSLIPDIDSKESKINHLFPLTKWVPYLFKHRGFFHSVFPVILIYYLFYSMGYVGIGLALSVGYAAHLVSDGLTKMGVNLLYPLSTWRIQGFIETNGAGETILLIVASLLVVVRVVGMIV